MKKHQGIKARVWAAAAVCMVGLTMSAPSLAQELEKLKVRLDWTPWGVQAPFHLAQQKGWGTRRRRA